MVLIINTQGCVRDERALEWKLRDRILSPGFLQHAKPGVRATFRGISQNDVEPEVAGSISWTSTHRGVLMASALSTGQNRGKLGKEHTCYEAVKITWVHSKTW